jgi:hypothetical protein
MVRDCFQFAATGTHYHISPLDPETQLKPVRQHLPMSRMRSASSPADVGRVGIDQGSKQIVANEEIKQQILNIGIRKLERAMGVSHHTINRIFEKGACSRQDAGQDCQADSTLKTRNWSFRYSRRRCRTVEGILTRLAELHQDLLMPLDLPV